MPSSTDGLTMVACRYDELQPGQTIDDPEHGHVTVLWPPAAAELRRQVLVKVRPAAETTLIPTVLELQRPGCLLASIVPSGQVLVGVAGGQFVHADASPLALGMRAAAIARNQPEGI